MGGNQSKSEITTSNNSSIVNKSSVDVLNKTMMNIANENIMKVLNDSAIYVSQKNIINLSGITTEDSLILDNVDQENTAVVQFDSQTISTMVNSVNTAITSKMVADITKSVDNNVLSNIVAKVAEKSKTGWGNTSIGDKDKTIVSTLNNVNVNNTTSTNLQNIVEACVKNTITTDKANKCISSMEQLNLIAVKDSKFKEVSIKNVTQKNALDVFSKCLIKDSTMSEITTSLANIADVKIAETTKTDTTIKTDADVSISKEKQGIADSISSGLSGLFSGNSMYISIGSSVSLCCILIIAVIGIVIIMTSEQGGKNIGSLAQTALKFTPQGAALNALTGSKGLSKNKTSNFNKFSNVPNIPNRLVNVNRPNIPNYSPPKAPESKNITKTGGYSPNLMNMLYSIFHF